VVALEGDVAFVEFGEVLHRAELAGGDALFEVHAAEHILKILHAIDLVDALLGRDDEVQMVRFPPAGLVASSGLPVIGSTSGLSLSVAIKVGRERSGEEGG
jgi:hypothetical protein